MILSNKEFFIKQTSTGESEVLNLGAKSADMLLSVFGTGTFSLQVLGSTSYEDDTFSPITYLNNDGFNTTNAISSFGKYYAAIKGYGRVKCVITAITGEVNVVGVISN